MAGQPAQPRPFPNGGGVNLPSVKTADHKPLDALVEAQHNALEEIKTIVWTPKITMPQLRKRVALALRNSGNE